MGSEYQIAKDIANLELRIVALEQAVNQFLQMLNQDKPEDKAEKKP